MHKYIILGASCYPCGSVAGRVEGTDEEFCRYVCYVRRILYTFPDSSVCSFSHTWYVCPNLSLSPWHEPILLCNLSYWSLKLFNLAPATLLSCFTFPLCLQSPNHIPPLHCEIKNVNWGFSVHWALIQGVKQEYKRASLVSEQRPLSWYSVPGYH